MRRWLPLTALAVLSACTNAQIVSVNVDTAGNTWTYVVSYSFEAGLTTSLRSFYLPIEGPVSNIRIEGDDHGWTYETDGSTFVRWFNPDPAPSQDDIETGEAMFFLLDSPFIESKPIKAVFTTWDTSLNLPGNTILAPTVVPVPEPATCFVASAGMLWLIRKRRRST